MVEIQADSLLSTQHRRPLQRIGLMDFASAANRRSWYRFDLRAMLLFEPSIKIRHTMRQNIAFIFLLLLGIGSIGASSNNVESDFWSHRFAVVPGIAYGEHPSQIMDGYLQGDWVGYPDYFKATVNPRPTLIWIHGGGWVEGNQRGNEPFFLHFLQNGWNVFSITYRLGPGTAPVAVDDAVCALKHVVDQSSEWPIDRNMIVIAGGSAGGHLALTTGILGSRPGHACYPGGGFKVAAIVNWFGITDIEKVEKFLAQTSPGQNYAGNLDRRYA